MPVPACPTCRLCPIGSIRQHGLATIRPLLHRPATTGRRPISRPFRISRIRNRRRMSSNRRLNRLLPTAAMPNTAPMPCGGERRPPPRRRLQAHPLVPWRLCPVWLPSRPRDSDTGKPAPAPAPTRVAQADTSVATEPTGASIPGALPAPAAGSRAPTTQVATLAPMAAAPEAAVPVAAPEPAASPTAPPTGAQPAVPPRPAVPQRMSNVTPSDAALGFKPSNAPPLDASLSQFVPMPIIAHYQETASNAGIGTTAPTRVASPSPSKLRKPRASEMGEGGPETMTGAVVANLDALQQSSTPTLRRLVFMPVRKVSRRRRSSSSPAIRHS